MRREASDDTQKRVRAMYQKNTLGILKAQGVFLNPTQRFFMIDGNSIL